MAELMFESSRQGSSAVVLSEAIQRGLAPDGGLYMPVRLPKIEIAAFEGVTALPEIARLSLTALFAGDRLQPSLEAIANAALNFEASLTPVRGAANSLFALELFHGPTAAFKDFGARFLAESLERLELGNSTPAGQPLTILVATSGDTGGAVAAAFHLRPWVRVVILYPKGMVSPRQEQQLTCWGDNILSLRVDGTFDDCQRLVKEAFLDFHLSAKHRFTSANSINIGRLLPQIVYYAASSLETLRRAAAPASYVIPAGNLGNAFAAVMARAMGFPIKRIVLAHNINQTVPEYLRTGQWEPRASIASLASAMDVGNPSNMERIRSLYPSIDAVREHLSASSIDDATIRARIGEDFMRYGREWCPHTATAAEVYSRLSAADRSENPWVVVATAHPAKFNEIVEPVIGKPIDVPQSLSRLLTLPRRFLDLPPELRAVAAALE